MPVRGRGKFPAAPRHEHTEASCIGKYVALKRSGSEKAIELLKEVGNAVKPIMALHGWRKHRGCAAADRRSALAGRVLSAELEPARSQREQRAEDLREAAAARQP